MTDTSTAPLFTAEAIRRAYRAGLALPAFNIPYLPMMEPVTKAIIDQDAFALIAVARLEFVKFEAQSQAAIKAEFDKWQDLGHMRLHQDHIPVIDEDGLRIDFLTELQSAIDLGFGSVMVDGSRLSLDENITATQRSVALAHRRGRSRRGRGLPCARKSSRWTCCASGARCTPRLGTRSTPRAASSSSSTTDSPPAPR